jgi:DNA-binding transcriptional MerR regulator
MTENLGAKAVALATGVSTDTLRHYERKGLLPPVHRTASGHRRYSSATVKRVLLIQRALVVGVSLNDLSRVLSVRDRGGAPCHNVRVLVGERLEILERQIEDLVVLRDELRTLLADWDVTLAHTPLGKPAHLLEGLAARVAIEQALRKRQRPHDRPRAAAMSKR